MLIQRCRILLVCASLFCTALFGIPKAASSVPVKVDNEGEKVASVTPVKQLARLDYDNAELHLGEVESCAYAGYPEEKSGLCWYGPKHRVLTYVEHCGFGRHEEVSRYFLVFEKGDLVEAVVRIPDLDFSIDSLRTIGVEPVWPDELLVGRGGPGQAYLWYGIPGTELVEMHSTRGLEEVDRFVIWFQEAPTMGNYSSHIELQEEHARVVDCDDVKRRYETSGGICIDL